MSSIRSARATATAALLLLILTSTAAAGAGRSAPPGGDVPAATKSAEIRVTLGRILAEHAFLLMQLMRAEAAKAPERDALRAVLEDNSVELADAVGSVYGAAAGDTFLDHWTGHIDLLVEYARAVAAGDNAKVTTTGRAIDEARDRLAALLVKVNPRLDAREGAAALRLHMNHMRKFADADPVAAYAAEREAFEHMFAFGDTFAKAIIKQYPDRFADSRMVFSPAADLRVRLNRLLGEHLLLAGEAMRTGLVGSAASGPAQAARAALEENTKDLADSIALVYGADAGAAFGNLWRTHINAYLDYIDGVKAKNEAEKQRTLRVIRSYGPQFGAFIASANNQLSADAVADLIHHHSEALIGQINAFAAKDYPRAFSTVREAYGHMFTVGDGLAGAIAAQFPDRFADLAALPGTATEHLPQADWSPNIALLGASALVALLLFLALGTRRLRRS